MMIWTDSSTVLRQHFELQSILTYRLLKSLCIAGLLVLHSGLTGQTFDTLIPTSTISIQFDSDKWDLTEMAIQQIDSLVNLQKDSLSHFILTGHTDVIGSEDYNLKLSQQRVEKVSNHFALRGVAKSRIQHAHFGESKPKLKGKSSTIFKVNRRVEVTITRPQRRRWIHGQILDDSTSTGVLAKVLVHGKEFQDSVMTETDGIFQIALPDNAIYRVQVIAEDHFFEQKYIKVSRLEPQELIVPLSKIAVGKAYTLPEFNFKGDLPILLAKSVPTLDLLYAVLSSSTFCIEIKGHVNYPNQPPCNLESSHYKLSQDRADMVKKVMIDRGIIEDRMNAKGYGNWEMLFPVAKFEKEMGENRRVEIVIIDCDSAYK